MFKNHLHCDINSCVFKCNVMNQFMYGLKITIFMVFQTFHLCQCWPGFQVLTERTEVTDNNRKFINLWMKTGRGNRTTIMSNATADIYRTIPETATVRVVGYEFKSNEYRRSAIDFSKYVCDYYNGEYQMLFKKTLEKIGHVPDKCPFEPGHYYWYNFVMEAAYIPFKPIGDKWLFEGNLTLDGIVLTRILWYVSIERNSEFYSRG